MVEETRSQTVTHLLGAWRGGDRQALDALTPIVYQELRRLASSYMRSERSGHSLQPTALIHEAYLRLLDGTAPQFNGRAHFFGVAAQIMRQILIDFARSRTAQKRGGGAEHVGLLDNDAISLDRTDELLAIHEALDKLALQDARKAKVIELRYFGGLNREEIAEALDMTLATVKRDLALGEAFLRRELTIKKAVEA
jgi:RNA polymerase sigma-70 factor (ECF subfamily)